jgi:hypothetical protein
VANPGGALAGRSTRTTHTAKIPSASASAQSASQANGDGVGVRRGIAFIGAKLVDRHACSATKIAAAQCPRMGSVWSQTHTT